MNGEGEISQGRGDESEGLGKLIIMKDAIDIFLKVESRPGGSERRG